MTKRDMHGPQQKMVEKSATDAVPNVPSSISNEAPAPQELNHIIEKPENAVVRSPRSVCSSVHLSSPSKLSVNACCEPCAKVTAPSSVMGMGISKSNRIIILLVVDSAFFFLELVVGKALVLFLPKVRF